MSHLAPDDHTPDHAAEPTSALRHTAARRRSKAVFLLPLIVVALAGGMAAFGQVGRGATGDAWRFAGRFHPMVLHVPIGAVAFLAFAELISVLTRRRVPVPRVSLLVFVVLGTLVTVAAGFALGQDTGYGQRLLNDHFIWGAAFLGAAGVGLAAALAGRGGMRGWRGPVYALSLVTMLVTLTIAGHLGASLTHGETYLTQYAPPTVRPWMERAFGIDATLDESLAASSESTAYTARVAPILAAHCYQCHGPERQRGGLRLDSVAAMFVGGQLGPAIVAGDAEASNVVLYMELPPDHEDHMPPAGKPQPSATDIALIRAWVANGASADALVAESAWLSTVTPATTSDGGDANPTPTTGEQAADVSSAGAPDPAVMAEEVARVNGVLGSGRPLGFLSRDSADLQFAAHSLVAHLSPDQLRELSGAAGQIVEMDLAFTPLDAAMVAALPPMPRLKRLNVAGTPVDDFLLAALLRKCPALESVVAYGTKLTDASLPALAAHPTLIKAVVSMSAVSPGAVEAARRARPELEIVAGE